MLLDPVYFPDPIRNYPFGLASKTSQKSFVWFPKLNLTPSQSSIRLRGWQMKLWNSRKQDFSNEKDEQGLLNNFSSLLLRVCLNFITSMSGFCPDLVWTSSNLKHHYEGKKVIWVWNNMRWINDERIFILSNQFLYLCHCLKI